MKSHLQPPDRDSALLTRSLDGHPLASQRIERWHRYALDTKPDHPLRVGIILARDVVPTWQAKALSMVVESGVGALALWIRPPDGNAPRRMDDSLRVGSYRALNVLLGRPPASQRVGVRDLFSGVPVLHAETRAFPNGRLEVLDGTVKAILDADLDLLLQLDGWSYSGTVLGAARHGLWRFRFGSHCASAAIAAFWALYHGQTEVSVELEQQLDGRGLARVLRQGVLAVNPASYRQTIERVMLAGTDFPLQVCRDLLLDNAAEFSEAPTPRPRHDLIPCSTQVLEVILRVAGAFLRRALSFAFVLDGWTPGRLDGGVERLLAGDASRVAWVRPQRRTRLLADPFIVPGTDGRIVLAEDLDHSEGVGRIVRITFPNDGGPLRTDLLFEEPGTHLSYPGLVRTGDGLYCIPEAASTGSVRAYRLSDDGGAVLESSTLISGLPAIDPTVFRFEGRWWLACTEAGVAQETHLWLYYADSLFGPWSAHARNPVLVDVSSARPAGIPFVHAGITYRPAQDCSRGYGGAVILRRILELTPRRFSEQDAVSVRPDHAGLRPLGLHTVSVDGDTVVIDGLRGVFHPLAGWYRISRARRAGRRAAGSQR